MKRHLFLIALVAAFFLTSGSVYLLRLHPWKTEPPSERILPPAAPLAQIETATPEELAKQDIATLNVACLEDLSGDQTDPDEIEREFALYADQVRRMLPHLHRIHDPGVPEEVNRILDVIGAIDVITNERHDTDSPSYQEVATEGAGSPRFPERYLIEGEPTMEQPPGTARPVLYVSLARRLGYPLALAATKGHLFARYVDAQGKAWDFEREMGPPIPLMPGVPDIVAQSLAGNNFAVLTHDDAYYKKWPVPVSEEEIRHNGWLRSMTPTEEAALFLEVRGSTLVKMGRFLDAEVAYAAAHRLNPGNRHSQECLGALIDKQLKAYKISWNDVQRTFQRDPPYIEEPNIGDGEKFDIGVK